MSDTRGYGSPTAFRRALTDKLRAKAETSRWTLPQLQRQMAYDRLLERLYLVDQGWIVKGATALLARDIGVRATIDIDVYREAARDVAEAELRAAAVKDIGDWFTFELGAGRPVAAGAPGVRIPVSAYIGPTVWASFNVDLVGSDLRMTGEPDPVPPLARVVMPDVEQHGYRAYPLVDHIADKVVAIFEPHGELGMPSTRFKDLVDIVAIVLAASVAAEPQLTALRSEAHRRGVALPARFSVPDRSLWERGYAAEAGRSLLPVAHTLDDALATVSPFLDPLRRKRRWDVGSPSPSVVEVRCAETMLSDVVGMTSLKRRTPRAASRRHARHRGVTGDRTQPPGLPPSQAQWPMPKPRPGEVLFRVRVRGAIPRPGKHPHDVEMLFGDSASADGSGKRVTYVLDRRGDQRYKRLTDPDTGEVLLEESGRLSDHHGHGSAKRR